MSILLDQIMVNERIKMESIRNEKSRMLTFRKRKTTLLKKVSDFSILCGVDACVIIFGPNQNDQPAATAETWPSNSDEADVLSTGTRHVISQENVTRARTILLPRRRR